MSQESKSSSSGIRAYFAAHTFARRFASTIFLFFLLFLAVYFSRGEFNGIGAVVLMTAVSTLALYEFYKLTEHFGGKPRKALGLLLGLALVPFFFYATSQPTEEIDARGAIPVMLVFAALMFAFGIYLMAKMRVPELAKSLATLWGVLYIPFCVGFYAILAGLHGWNGVLLCVWIVLAAKFTDIGGLLGGMFFGKHKLAPVLSPKKTWEGVVGGVVLSVVGSVALVAAFNYFDVWSASYILKFQTFTPAYAALFALPIAGVSVVSDLIESAVKRASGDKDSGATIPGIGGALDLLDSLIFVAPVGFLLIEYVLKR